MKEMIARVGDILTHDGIGSVCLTGEEIVRCKDCKFRQSRVSRIIDGKECNLCEMVKGYKPAEWFCADGERRADWHS